MLDTYCKDEKPIWIDLYNPEDHEIKEVEERLNIQIPTREKMGEIEESSRLYEDDAVLFMTATLIASADSEHPLTFPTTFIIRENILLTIRYAEFKTFERVIAKIHRNNSHALIDGQLILLELLETIVSRMGDILETISIEINTLSDDIFKINKGEHLHEVLISIGKKGTLNSKCKESIENLSRLLTFIDGRPPFETKKKALFRIHRIQRDVNSLRDHISFLFNKINFLLDATLGLINIEQNAIIKIFSVAAVIFLPPTLIASIYGMNFKKIPELDLIMGYPLALFLMVVSAVLTYGFFKRKRWL